MVLPEVDKESTLSGHTITTKTPTPNIEVSSASATTLRRQPRKRMVPNPNTILDTVRFIETLEELNLYGTKILPMHILAFYQALHRQHYPTLSEFVNNYYTNERKAQLEHSNRGQRMKRAIDSELDDSNEVSVATQEVSTNTILKIQQSQQPLKNRVSNKKNFNRMQLPKALLDFLQSTDQYVTLTSTVAQHKTSSDRTTTKLIIQLHDEQIIESVIMRYSRPNKGGAEKQKSKTGYGNGRASLCVSSQCGCAMGCTVRTFYLMCYILVNVHFFNVVHLLTSLIFPYPYRRILYGYVQFCATGTMGLSGNLSTGEILEQIIHADRILADEWNDRINQPIDIKTTMNEKTLPKLDLIRNVVFMGMGEVS